MTNQPKSLRKLAEQAFSEERWVDAEKLFRDTLHHLELSLGSDNFEVASTLHCLARVLIELGRDDEAEKLRQRADKIMCSAE